MNKMMTSVLAVGAGMAAISYAKRNNMMSTRTMKKMQRRITKAMF